MSRLAALPRLRSLLRLGLQHRACSGAQEVRKENIFFDPTVQTILLRLQGNDYSKVFRTRKLGVEPDRPIYQFITQQELEEAMEEVKVKADRKLLMPPVMEARLDTTQVLETDPLLQGFDTCKYIFADITYGVSDRQRITVARDPDGSLRTCSWPERDRVNLTYYPREGRKHYTPAMFEPENLKEIMGPKKYEYILDRNCLQFEPDHPTYVRTLDLVHSHVTQTRAFDSLESTRHYGPMVFNLCWHRQQDELLVHLVARDRLTAAVDTVHVYLKTHPACALAAASDLPSLSPEDLLRRFCKLESVKAGKITMVLEKLLEEKANLAKMLASQGAQ